MLDLLVLLGMKPVDQIFEAPIHHLRGEDDGDAKPDDRPPDEAGAGEGGDRGGE